MSGPKGVVVVLTLIALLATPAVAHAYVGPGAGIGLIGAALGLLLAVFMAIGVVVTWPLRKLRKRAKQDSGPQAPEADSAVPNTANR